MNKPSIISVVSGKGGVGKTMLSVAIANELAAGRRTLLLDLDFFNRGLTGLFASSKLRTQCRRVEGPKFLRDEYDLEWSLAEVKKNLLVVFYDDLDKSQSGVLA